MANVAAAVSELLGGELGSVQHVSFELREEEVSASSTRSKPGKALHHHGYAFVILRRPEDVERLEREWVWEGDAPGTEEVGSTLTLELRRVGFRALSK